MPLRPKRPHRRWPLAAVACLAAGFVLADEAEISQVLASRHLIIPVTGVSRSLLRNTFSERRVLGAHEALDIAAPRGTPVIAVDDGRVAKLFLSLPGGRTIYQFDPHGNFAYYYAHLDAYAEGLREGMLVKRGDLLGYVGSTGNAAAHAPHLHFAIFRLGPEKRWWQGSAVNPYPFLNGADH
jgi:murein DD-endopeptidase MepM/ murein hydrolase activator NlpD